MNVKLLRLLNELVNRHLLSKGLEKRRNLDSRLLPSRPQESRPSRRDLPLRLQPVRPLE